MKSNMSVTHFTAIFNFYTPETFGFLMFSVCLEVGRWPEIVNRISHVIDWEKLFVIINVLIYLGNIIKMSMRSLN